MRWTARTFLIAALLAGGPASASGGELTGLAVSRTSWPTASFPTLDESRQRDAVSSPTCQEALAFGGLARVPGVESELKSDGLVVVKGGTIVYDSYVGPFTRQTRHPIWSASKSATQMIAGAVIQRGVVGFAGAALSLDTRLADAFPERPPLADPENAPYYRQVTLRHLLDAGSGILWSESYEAGVVGSNVLAMLYISDFVDMAAYVLTRPFQSRPPGTLYNYSSGNLSAAMAMLRQAYLAAGMDYDRMPWDVLFHPIGIQSAVFEQDGAGVFVGSSYAHMTPEDMARLGYLYLNDGCWGLPESQVGTAPGQYEPCGDVAGPGWRLGRIMPAGWVDLTRSPNPSYLHANTVVTSMLSDGVYGMTWWLNVPSKGFTAPSYPAVPEDMFAALGHYGQLIIVIPSHDLVIARTGNDMEYNSKIDRFVGGLVSCFAGLEVSP